MDSSTRSQPVCNTVILVSGGDLFADEFEVAAEGVEFVFGLVADFDGDGAGVVNAGESGEEFAPIDHAFAEGAGGGFPCACAILRPREIADGEVPAGAPSYP